MVLILLIDHVNAEVKEMQADEHGTEDLNDHRRKMLEAIEDRDWHVSHLKSMDFDTNCKEETFRDKVKRYRSALRNDGALVEFVSAHALPFNKDDIPKDTCKSNLSHRSRKNKLKLKAKAKADETEISLHSTDIDKKQDSVTTNDEIKPATVSVRDKKKHKQENLNETNKRRSEYQFSSDEYYDETQDFSADVCPDAVEVIELELDTIRSYDIECEATLEWRSLE